MLNNLSNPILDHTTHFAYESINQTKLWNTFQPTILSILHTLPPLIKCLLSGSSFDLFLSSKTSFCCSARSSGDLSGLIKTLPKSSELRRCLALVKICCTIVELVIVTLTGLSATCFLSLGLIKPILLASIFGFSPSSNTWPTLDRPYHITAHLSLL